MVREEAEGKRKGDAGGGGCYRGWLLEGQQLEGAEAGGAGGGAAGGPAAGVGREWTRSTPVSYRSPHTFKTFRTELNSSLAPSTPPFLLPSFFPFSFLSVFLQPHLQHMETPRLRAESELQLLDTAIATATPDVSFIFDLHCSL